ncbi:MAG: hypothetical protein V4638_01695 [Bacteroidota bacterium]
MKKILSSPLYVFVLTFLLINIPLWVFAINFFPGEIVYEEGLATNKVEAPLSLSYFIGLGYEDADMVGIKDFYLTFKGTALAVCMCIGFPAILAGRVWSKKK